MYLGIWAGCQVGVCCRVEKGHILVSLSDCLNDFHTTRLDGFSSRSPIRDRWGSRCARIALLDEAGARMSAHVLMHLFEKRASAQGHHLIPTGNWKHIKPQAS